MRPVWVLALAAGCYHRIDATAGGDASVDADADATPQHCFMPTGLFPICVNEPLAPTYTAPSNGRIDTNVAASCTTTVPVDDRRATELCVIAADAITIGSPVHAAGFRPLVLLARMGMSVTSSLDADSKVLEPGAGGTSTCPGANAGMGEASGESGAGGGAGGSFQTVGGAGGSNGGTATGGPISPTTDITLFDAGLNGGAGGNLLSGTSGGDCGLGGGAIYLYSEGTLAVTGTVTAFGLGGFPGKAGGTGAGGGGSGGMIVLEGQLSTSPTTVLGATGAGGGGGGNSSAAGSSGTSPTISTVSAQPVGGAAPSSAGAGGKGATGPNMPATAGTPALMAGGGGGGGGAGVIRILPPGQLPVGLIYPPAT